MIQNKSCKFRSDLFIGVLVEGFIVRSGRRENEGSDCPNSIKQSFRSLILFAVYCFFLKNILYILQIQSCSLPMLFFCDSSTLFFCPCDLWAHVV